MHGWESSASPRNVSSERMRESRIRELLTETPALRELRRRLVPKGMRNRIRKAWGMRNRPNLSDATRSQLEARFDLDLHTLGSWLGLALCCANFDEVARNGPHDWVAESEGA